MLIYLFFKNWLVGFTNANKYQGVIEFIQEKPLNYKRVKSELKKLFSNRNSYYFLLKILKNKLESPIDSTTFKIRKANYKIKNIRNFSTSAISDITNSSPILVEGGEQKNNAKKLQSGRCAENLSSTVGYGRYTKIEKQMVKLPSYQESVIMGIFLSDGHLFSAKLFTFSLL